MLKKMGIFFIVVGLFVFPHFSSKYILHIAILILLWSYIATVWAYMGQFGLVSLGHGAFLGIGAYTSALLLNYYNITPIAGMLVGGLIAVLLALLFGYPCFRMGVIGDYFALVTLALAEMIMLLIIALREITGGSLGMTLNTSNHSLLYLTTDSKLFFYYLILGFLFLSLGIWKLIKRSRIYRAMKAIGEDETAAASVGINVAKYKTLITVISAFFTALGGTLYGQYVTYINPHTLSGVGVSLSIPFKAILGGIFNMLGPSVGAFLIVTMEESFRVLIGSRFIGISDVLYGVALIVLIIFLPRGLYGTLVKKLSK